MVDAAGLMGITLTVRPDLVNGTQLWRCGIWVGGVKPRYRFWTQSDEIGKRLVQDLLAAALVKAIDLG